MKKLDTRKIRKFKVQKEKKSLQMLTCYDFQTATLLNQSDVDLILVGDSVGNVILGYESTIPVSLNEMILFGSAVKRGCPNKFLIVDLPFGNYGTLAEGVRSASKLFKSTQCEAIKLEGAFAYQLELIQRLTQIGIPVMGHIGLTPQSVHEQGGYFIHGKNDVDQDRLIQEAINLEKAGAFAIVLECVAESVAAKITKKIQIPTIGIGSGRDVDGQVLVINDLLHLGPHDPPQFCKPIVNLYKEKEKAIKAYFEQQIQFDQKKLSP